MLKVHNIVTYISGGKRVSTRPFGIRWSDTGYYKRESGLLLVKVVCNALCGAQAHESLNWN